MRRPRGTRGEGRIGCIIWLIIVAFTGYMLYKFVPVKMASARFEDFMAEEAGFASIRGVREIERNILTKAKDLELPVTKDNLTITKSHVDPFVRGSTGTYTLRPRLSSRLQQRH